jgi:transcriptional regulator of acetoin/glycerol metabolism
MRLSAAAGDALVAYDWPGNVRELERLIEHVVALSESDVIELDDLPPTVRGEYVIRLLPSLERNETMREWATRYARLIVQRCGGNKREASRVLGISYHTLGSYLRRPIPGVVPGEPWAEAQPTTEEPSDTICTAEV